jgi:hypothetical protein
VVEGLAHKWYGAACPEVALDDLNVVPLRHELNIEWTSNSECLCDPACIRLNLADSFDIQLLSRKDDSRITAVHSRVLQMLSDGVV